MNHFTNGPGPETFFIAMNPFSSAFTRPAVPARTEAVLLVPG